MATLKHRDQKGARSVYALIALTRCKGGAMSDRRVGRSKDAGKAKRQDRRDNGYCLCS